MKPSELDLPAEISGFVTRASQWRDPPGATRERLRGRLGWAFQGHEDEAVMRSPRPGPIPIPARQPDRRSWRGVAIGRAAAAMVLAHIPLALAGLGVVGVAIPVTQLVLGRHVWKHASVDPPVQLPTRTQPSLPATQPRAPSVLIVPGLPPPPAEFDATVSPPPSPPPVPSVVAHTAPSALPAPRRGDDVALSVERGLLDQARLALVRGNPSGALARLTEHQARYPDSQLAEVREALAIQALLRAGRVADARFRDDAFRRRFPTSLLQPALDAALQE